MADEQQWKAPASRMKNHCPAEPTAATASFCGKRVSDSMGRCQKREPLAKPICTLPGIVQT